MVIIRSISPTQVQVDGRTFSRQSFDIASTFIQRKAMGQRGTLVNPSGDFDKDASAIANLLRLDPQLQSAIESASRLRSQALASGFASTEEFLQVSGAFARVPRTPTAPARALTPQEQLLAVTEGRGLTPTQLRLQKELLQFPKELALPDLPMSVRQDLSKQPSFAQRVIAGDIGEKVIPSPRLLPQLFPLQRPEMTAKEFQTKLKQLGLPTSVIAGFIPTTPLELGIFGGTGLLLGGAGGRVVQLTTEGVIGAIGGFIAIDENLPIEERIAGGLVAIAPLLIRLRIPTGKKGESRFALLTEELEGKVVKKKKKVLNLNAIAEELATKPTNQAKIQDIRNILKEIAKTKDPKLRKAQFNEATKLFKRAYGKEGAKSLLKDFIQQEGAILQKQLPKIKGARVPRTPRQVPVLKKQPSQINLQRTQKTQLRNQKRITQSKKTLGLRFKEAQALKQLPKTKQTAKQRQVQLQTERSALDQAVAQRQGQALKQTQAQRLVSATKTIQLLQPRLSFAQARALARKQLLRKGLLVPIPKPKLLKKKVKKITAVIVPPKDKKFNVFSRRKGIDQRIGSFKTEKKAFSKLTGNLDRTIRASGFVTDKRTGLRIKPPTPKGFRLSKTRPNVLVERRSKRLDSSLEKQQIQQARKLKRSNRLPKPFTKIIRRKK